MPKRRFTRKRFKRGTVKRKRARKVATLGSVRRLISASTESKWRSFDFTTPVDNVTASVDTVNIMAQGDSRTTRTGNRIENVGLRCALTIEPSGAAQQATRVRVMLVMDKQPNGVGIIGGDLFPTGTAAANRFYAPYNLNTVPRRYKILWDKLFLLRQGVAGATAAGMLTQFAQQPIYMRKSFKLKSKTKYNDGNAGTIADVITPNISWVLISSQGAGQAPLVSIHYDFIFKDA